MYYLFLKRAMNRYFSLIKSFYALKRIPLESGVLEETTLAMNEVKLLAALSHHNIIRYYDSFIEKDKLYILMEYAECGKISLIQVICSKELSKRRKRSSDSKKSK